MIGERLVRAAPPELSGGSLCVCVRVWGAFSLNKCDCGAAIVTHVDCLVLRIWTFVYVCVCARVRVAGGPCWITSHALLHFSWTAGAYNSCFCWGEHTHTHTHTHTQRTLHTAKTHTHTHTHLGFKTRSTNRTEPWSNRLLLSSVLCCGSSLSCARRSLVVCFSCCW